MDSARKHGVADVDILHAFTNAIRVHALDGYLMLVGPAADGQLLELGYNAARDRIFRAMSARPKYLLGGDHNDEPANRR